MAGSTVFSHQPTGRIVRKLPLPLFDTHAHLCAEMFEEDLEAVIGRARDAGLGGVLAVGENLEDGRRNLEIADRFPDFVRPAAGLYPTALNGREAEELAAFLRHHRSRFAAIGEVGLDRWKVQDPEDREVQRLIFELFIDLSAELNLPLSVHSRSAGRHAVECLLRRGASRVILHAFDGKPSAALPALEAGYLFSIPPSVVRSRQKQRLAARLPLECLLLETDSPVLGPDPARRNEPSNLGVTLRVLADIKGVSEEALAEVVAENERRLFGPSFLPPSP